LINNLNYYNFEINVKQINGFTGNTHKRNTLKHSSCTHVYLLF